MNQLFSNPTPLISVTVPRVVSKNVNLWIKREDLIHPQISGNKWHKLQLNLEHALQTGHKSVVSFGGAFSNHLHALAWAGRQYGLKTLGLVRGELREPLNPTLLDCQNWGMKLLAISREEYRRRNDADFLEDIARQFAGHRIIPEGGANQLAIAGCARWGREIQQQLPEMDFLCVACGTGATLAGLVAGLSPSVKVLGFPALKNDNGMQGRIQGWLSSYKDHGDWELIERFHFGGYAKLTSELVGFMDAWQRHTRIPIEPIYTGKLLYGVTTLLEEGYFPSGSNVVVIHSGGMQGIRGMQDKIKELRTTL